MRLKYPAFGKASRGSNKLVKTRACKRRKLLVLFLILLGIGFGRFYDLSKRRGIRGLSEEVGVSMAALAGKPAISRTAVTQSTVRGEQVVRQNDYRPVD